MNGYSSLGPRKQPLGRGVFLGRAAGLGPTGPLAEAVPLQARTGLQRYQPIRPVSDKRRAENRVRRAMVADLFGGEIPLCWVPWCGQWADDLHEPLSRARAGSITDPANATPLCRAHHDQITFRPESELGWAFRLGLIRHDQLCCQGRNVCERYAEGGEAA